MKRLLLVSSLVLGSAISAQAQLVINPNQAQFTASPDHNAVENTVPIVTNYELRIFPANSTVVLRTLNLNKPTPDSNNLIVVTITSLILALPAGDYYGKVAAIGPGGENVSTASNPFQVAVRAPAAPINLLFTK